MFRLIIMAVTYAYKEVDDVRSKYIDVNGLTRFMQIMHSISMTDEESDAVKRTRAILARALKQARKEGITQLANMIPNNRRHAEQALRSKVYSKKSGVLGGNLSMLRGGNRAHRNGGGGSRPLPKLKDGSDPNWSDRTKQMWGYQGTDAQFLLYWLSEGTSERMAGLGRRNRKTGRYGNISTSRARQAYFGGTHNVGRIDPGKINMNLYALLERVVNGEVIPEIDKLWRELANK